MIEDQWLELPEFERQAIYLDTITYLPNDILVKLDRATMAFGLEGRIPLLDPRVVEFAWRLPLQMKVRPNQGKWLLRQVLYRYVPREASGAAKDGIRHSPRFLAPRSYARMGRSTAGSAALARGRILRSRRGPRKMGRASSRSRSVAVPSVGHPYVSALVGTSEVSRTAAIAESNRSRWERNFAAGRTTANSGYFHHFPGFRIALGDARCQDCGPVSRESDRRAPRSVPAMLATFAEYDIHATWATVGFLFFARRSELLRALPVERPQYTDPRLSPYAEMDTIGEDESEDPFHFARSLLEQIRSQCGAGDRQPYFFSLLLPGAEQSIAAFRADLQAALAAAADFGVALKSIVFPRNQYDEAHLRVCGEMGLRAFRGNPRSWLYRPRIWRETEVSGYARRDCWIRIAIFSRTIAIHSETRQRMSPMNLPASRFLRPYTANWLPLRHCRSGA